jgi:heat shock protein HslJ
MTKVTWGLTLLLCLAACGLAPKKEPPPKAFVGTKWQVQLELPLAGEQPYFRFGDGRMEGFGGCNRVNARYVQDTVGARAIAIGRMDRGTRICDGSAIEAEKRMLDVLQAVSSYSVTADTMTMTGSGGTLKFRADPPYEAQP